MEFKKYIILHVPPLKNSFGVFSELWLMLVIKYSAFLCVQVTWCDKINIESYILRAFANSCMITAYGRSSINFYIKYFKK